MSQLTSFLLMNKFLIDKKYDQVLNVFDKYLDTLNDKVKDQIKPQSFQLKNQNQLIPFGHLRLVMETLLTMVN